MIAIQCLYKSIEQIKSEISSIDIQKECVVQIFTTLENPYEAVEIAKNIQKILPKAQIIGSSVSGVIYKGTQYENKTLIGFEQYENVKIYACTMFTNEKTSEDLALEIKKTFNKHTPSLLRMFVGNKYNFASNLMQNIAEIMPGAKIAGGMADGHLKPYVFNCNDFYYEALVCVAIYGEKICVYTRANTAQEEIEQLHKITKIENNYIKEIDNAPAISWIEENLGGIEDSETVANGSLVHFQIKKENFDISRYMKVDTENLQIIPYFETFKENDNFRISYQSPSKCVYECKETVLEIQNYPIEQFFCYISSLRKTYMDKCIEWELSPYNKDDVNGVFLLGEFSNYKTQIELLGGSCVIATIAEKEKYMPVDIAKIEGFNAYNNENNTVIELLNRKQTVLSKKMGIIETILETERESRNEPYVNIKLNADNMMNYEKDKQKYNINKICLLKIENADILMSYIGQEKYYERLQFVVNILNNEEKMHANERKLHIYAIHFDAIVIATNDDITKDDFIKYMHELEQFCKKYQEEQDELPFLIRMAVACNKEFLLEHAYSQLRSGNNAQDIFVQDDEVCVTTQDELKCIKMIKNAIANNGVVPHYQGIYNNETKKIDKYEALMRVRDENGEMIAPVHFMDVAKKYLLYLELNLKMFEMVVEDFSKIDCKVNINVSAYDLASERFRNSLIKRMKNFHKPSNITIEILEDESFSEVKELQPFIKTIRELGVKIAIDDFGAGYSNLLEILKINPDDLKIDGQIIKNVHNSYENEVIVEVTTALAEKLSIDLVAEFVENEEIQDKVAAHGILRSQGYLFSKPQQFASVYKVEKKVQI